MKIFNTKNQTSEQFSDSMLCSMGDAFNLSQTNLNKQRQKPLNFLWCGLNIFYVLSHLDNMKSIFK